MGWNRIAVVLLSGFFMSCGGDGNKSGTGREGPGALYGSLAAIDSAPANRLANWLKERNELSAKIEILHEKIAKAEEQKIEAGRDLRVYAKFQFEEVQKARQRELQRLQVQRDRYDLTIEATESPR